MTQYKVKKRGTPYSQMYTASSVTSEAIHFCSDDHAAVSDIIERGRVRQRDSRGIMAGNRLLKSESIISLLSRAWSPLWLVNVNLMREVTASLCRGCSPAVRLADAKLQCPPLGSLPQRGSAGLTQWLS